MFSAFFLSVAFFGAGDPPVVATTSAKPALETYRESLPFTAKTADAQVRLALWCEAHGLTAERLKHLSLAVLYDPSNALARGLMGLVAYHGKWGRPEVVGEEIQNDPAHQSIIKEYLDRRARTPDTADAQMKLAAWCDEKGLKEQAIAHYTAVTRISASHQAAWKHLGYQKQGGRWVKPDEAAAAKQEAAQQKQADKHWKPILEKLRDKLESKDAARRVKSEHDLTDVTDPRAVPMIWAIYSRGNERLQLAAVQMLGQIDSPAASNALAGLAVFSPAGVVRSRAIEVLKTRDPRDVVGRLIRLVRKPFKYQVRYPDGPASPGVLFAEGDRFNIERFYQSMLRQTPVPSRLFSPDVPFDPFNPSTAMSYAMGGQFALSSLYSAYINGLGGVRANSPHLVQAPGQFVSTVHPGQSMAGMPPNAAAIVNHLRTGSSHQNAASDFMLSAASLAAQTDLQIGRQIALYREFDEVLKQQLARDVQFLEATNAGISLLDDRTLPVLTAITGQNLGVEPESWNKWWADQLGYSYQSSVPETKPTYTDVVTTNDLGLSHSCFAADTLVQTIDGPQPIESIRVGDRVLSQATSTGELAFQPVVATHLNPPASTLRISVGSESIVATGIHRFWVAGKGWTMARELKPGNRLRMVGGTVQIESIETDKTQPVYNLDVAGNRDFFVGKSGLLVHDFSFVQPVSEPFDRQSDLGSTVSAPK